MILIKKNIVLIATSVFLIAGNVIGEEITPSLEVPMLEEKSASAFFPKSLELENKSITTGFKWVKVQQVYHAINSSQTWAYLESPVNAWINCSDDRCEDILIAASASGNYLGINFTGTNSSSFNYMRLYKN